MVEQTYIEMQMPLSALMSMLNTPGRARHYAAGHDNQGRLRRLTLCYVGSGVNRYFVRMVIGLDGTISFENIELFKRVTEARSLRDVRERLVQLAEDGFEWKDVGWTRYTFDSSRLRWHLAWSSDLKFPPYWEWDGELTQPVLMAVRDAIASEP